jgi:gamma-glutamylcyclotransferase (GGCT)/AIG2-like uncharacterized protein YtfP
MPAASPYGNGATNDIDTPATDRDPFSTIRPLFVYGSLMLPSLLAGLLTGDNRQVKMVEQRRKPATLHGYSRRPVLDAEHPAVIKGQETDRVEGYLFYPRSLDDQRKLDSFESDSYYRTVVSVVDTDGQTVQAHVYLWCDDLEDLGDGEWNFEEFEGKWR